MVYDVPRNFVGDTHWRESNELADGDELELETGGVLVQVGEATGKTQQDLSGLFEKRLKDREERRKTACRQAGKGPVTDASSPVRAVARTPCAAPRPVPTSLPHRSLSSLLQTPLRPPGRARVPVVSPFDQRHTLNGHDLEERQVKRRKKRNDNQNPSSGSEIRPESIAAPNLHRPQPVEVLEISDDDRDLSEPAKPAKPQTLRKQARKRRQQTSNGPTASITPTSSPLFVPQPPQPNPRESTPDPPQPPLPPRTGPLQKKAKPLRLAPRAKRKKLLCQPASPSHDPSSPPRPGRGHTPPQPQRQCNANEDQRPDDELSLFQQEQSVRIRARLEHRRSPRMELDAFDPSQPDEGAAEGGQEQRLGERVGQDAMDDSTSVHSPRISRSPSRAEILAAAGEIGRQLAGEAGQRKRDASTLGNCSASKAPSNLQAAKGLKASKASVRNKPLNAPLLPPQAAKPAVSARPQPELTESGSKAADIGPWSSEALYLFEWRPPMKGGGK